MVSLDLLVERLLADAPISVKMANFGRVARNGRNGERRPLGDFGLFLTKDLVSGST